MLRGLLPVVYAQKPPKEQCPGGIQVRYPPLDAKEQSLYSELPKDARASYHMYKPNHPTEGTHFDHLYPQSHSFCDYPKLINIGEGWNKDRLVNWKICLLAQLPLHINGPGSNICISADIAPICLSISCFISQVTASKMLGIATQPVKFTSKFSKSGCFNWLNSATWIQDLKKSLQAEDAATWVGRLGGVSVQCGDISLFTRWHYGDSPEVWGQTARSPQGKLFLFLWF